MQIVMSPYYGKVDLSAVADVPVESRQLDRVSMADLLRNGFVYPPHSIYEDVKLVTFGFFPEDDLETSPRFRFKFRDAGKSPAPPSSLDYWVEQYHRKLCTAVAKATEGIARPWQLQSGGKDSTSLAIAIAEARPDTVCLTYLGGREEDEVESARHVARTLGLRHEALVCNPGRAYDRYVELAGRMPLLTGDFALLSYVELAWEVHRNGGDGVIDGLGSDSYFGAVQDREKRLLSALARGWHVPGWLSRLPLVERSFALCYLLGTLQMNPDERVFPGSRFSDAEVDELFGQPLAARSRARLEIFREEVDSAVNYGERRDILMSIAGSTGAFAKGLYTTSALGMQASYPYCDADLREWVYREVPREFLFDSHSHRNKVLVRTHITRRFGELPYVRQKGSFRFDLVGLAQTRFDAVHAQALQARDMLPGAVSWLERNRRRLGNKFFASKFYLLAVLLPWINTRTAAQAATSANEAVPASA
ncbi:MAG TPA: asparagine synthase-related protein [Lysobacter sp.]|nr:asparagine synthase-related protein [Lysobacter sp.]